MQIRPVFADSVTYMQLCTYIIIVLLIIFTSIITSILEHKRMSIEGLYTTFEASMNVSYNTNVLTISDNACTKNIF